MNSTGVTSFDPNNFSFSVSEGISMGRGGGRNEKELASPLCTAVQKEMLLILAGDVEKNPGPLFSEVGK